MIECSPFKAITGHEPVRALHDDLPSNLESWLRFAKATVLQDDVLNDLNDNDNLDFELSDTEIGDDNQDPPVVSKSPTSSASQ